MLVRALIPLLVASAVRAATHVIAVGSKGNTFDPESTTANAGDIITFSLSVALFLPPSQALTTRLTAKAEAIPLPNQRLRPRAPLSREVPTQDRASLHFFTRSPFTLP